ncbi:MFS transporter [Shimazuella kribbensis]|uniref:MFS transporter n=1 Tax=Shimazuella kribbensis TaxID=139808 RepID=UPI00048B2698|nr:MFS transporter [Shimazuella kribbensis]
MTNISSIFTTYRGFNREVWFLVLISFTTRMITFVLLPFMIIYLGKIGMDATEIGWIIGSGWILGSIAGPLIGYLSDRIGTKPVYFSVMIVWLLSFIGFAYVDNFYLLLIISLINGIGRTSIDPLLLTRMYRSVDVSKQTNVSKLNYIAFNAGIMIGPFIGTELSKSFGSEVFIGSACVFTLFLLLDPFFRSKSIRKVEKQTITLKATLRVLWADQTLKWYILAGTIFAVAYIQIDSTLPLALQAAQLFSWYSPLSLLNALVAVIITTPLMNWAEKRSLSSMMLLSVVFVMLGFFCFINSWIPLYFLGFLFISLSEILFYPLWRESIANLNRSLQGTYLGTTNFSYIGYFVGSALGGELFQWWGSGYTFLFFAIISMATFVAFRIGQRTLDYREANTVPVQTTTP